MIRLRPSGADEVLIKRVRDWYEPGPGVFIAPQALFNPALLFTTGVNGTCYDPSDLNTLFQDAAGTTPVTAVEQPVGLMLDKSKGLVLGPELVTNGTFDTDTNWTKGTGWSISAGTANLAGTAGTYPTISQNYAYTANSWYRVTFTVSNYAGGVVQFVSRAGGQKGPQASANGTYSFYFLASGTDTYFGIQDQNGGAVLSIDNVNVKQFAGNHAFNSSGNSANFPVLSARYNINTGSADFSSGWTLQGTATKTGENVVNTPANNDWIFKGVSPVYAGQTVTYSALLSGSGTATLVLYDNVSGFSGVITVTLTSTPTRYSITKTFGIGAVDLRFGLGRITGATATAITASDHDLRVANDALNQPAYQRVNTATDYDTVGFKPYLRFNGTNQWLQTNSIDFTYGDKMFVCAGVRKLSDAAAGVFVELSSGSNASNGSFHFAVPATDATPDLSFFSRGTVRIEARALGFQSPITNVISGIGNISGDQAILRINGTQAAINTGDQGTGNYGNYPLYIGARAGSSLWFNGRLHQLVVAGKQASASEIGQTEDFTNQKTGAF